MVNDKSVETDCLGLMSSSNPFDNSKGLALLIESADYSAWYIERARDLLGSSDLVAFKFPLKSTAQLYLYLAGVLRFSELDEDAAYLADGLALSDVGLKLVQHPIAGATRGLRSRGGAERGR